MAKRPEKPEDATEAATMGIFPVGASRSAPPSASAELTPPPGGTPPEGESEATPPPEPTMMAPPTQVPVIPDPPETPTAPGASTSAIESTGDRPEASLLTPTPIPGSPTGSGSGSGSGESGESLGVQGKIQPGQTLFGRYLVDSMLGEGGMGTVWLVRHLELDSFRALKLIISGIAFDPQARARFKREARVMARLSHPNAVVVHDARMGKDAAFIEMEYIRGHSLNKLMRQGEPMKLDVVARIVEQLCDVLQEAHERKIVHRDLKPSNLMLVEGRAPGKELLKVLDFGIAKIIEAESETSGSDFRTNTGAFMGSALWTSPEQASGGTVDGRSDIYSVGIILYEMLTGYRPFSGQITKVIYNHLYTPPPKFAEKNAEVKYPAGVEQVVLQCLAKNPDERYQSARALGEAFHRALPQGMGSPSAVNFSGADRLPVSSPLDSPATEMASESGLPGTDPANPAFRRPKPSDHGLEATWGGPAPVTTEAATGRAGASIKPPLIRGLPTKPGSGRWKALIPLAIMLGLIGLIVFAFVVTHRPQTQVKSALQLPAGFQAEYPPGAPPNALPSALIRQSDGVRFIHMSAGNFKMGNSGFASTSNSDDDEDQPAHRVALSDYYIQETEVTNGEIEAYFLANHVELKDRPNRWTTARDTIASAGPDPKMYPAVGITHEQAAAFAKSVGGLLPTEAQWEYAARSLGKDDRYAWGNEPKLKKGIANVDSLGDYGKFMTTVEVRKFEKDKTAQGVYDLMGNVREWCRDVWSEYVESDTPLSDPVGPDPPQIGRASYVVRGGSFASWANKVFTTRPRRPDPKDNQDRSIQQFADDQTSDEIGFRVVIEWPRRP